MPLYEYQCDACGHCFEQIQKFSDPLVEICPSCGKSAVRKLLSSPAIQFKGSGWYITDYAKKNTSDAGNVAQKEDKSADKSGSADKKESGSADATSKSSDSSSTASTATKDTGSPKKDG